MRYVEERLAELAGRPVPVSGELGEEFLGSMGAATLTSSPPTSITSPEQKSLTREYHPRENHRTLTREYHRNYQRLRRKTAVGRREMMASNLRALHAISLERYAQIYEAQGGRCAICGDGVAMGYDADRLLADRLSIGSRGPRVHVRGPRAHGAHIDHDHGCCPGGRSCGRCIRGLLCNRCNTALRNFRDNAQILRKAADYVSAGPL